MTKIGSAIIWLWFSLVLIVMPFIPLLNHHNIFADWYEYKGIYTMSTEEVATLKDKYSNSVDIIQVNSSNVTVALDIYTMNKSINGLKGKLITDIMPTKVFGTMMVTTGGIIFIICIGIIISERKNKNV